MSSVQSRLIWLGLVIVILVPIAAAGFSPLLAWRQPVYIIAGFAGIIAMALMLVQPLLMGRYLPGISVMGSRKVHKWIGGALVALVLLHVGGLWITSPPDVVDALLFASPTPFSIWGVTAMWVVFFTALLAAIRRPLRLKPSTWRIIHTVSFLVIVVGTVIHALLIEGAMETITKVGLCALILVATFKVVLDFRVWATVHKASRS